MISMGGEVYGWSKANEGRLTSSRLKMYSGIPKIKFENLSNLPDFPVLRNIVS